MTCVYFFLGERGLKGSPKENPPFWSGPLKQVDAIPAPAPLDALGPGRRKLAQSACELAGADPGDRSGLSRLGGGGGGGGLGGGGLGGGAFDITK